MPEDDKPVVPDTQPDTDLRTRAESLERRLAEIEHEAQARVVRAELKVEAVRAGLLIWTG